MSINQINALFKLQSEYDDLILSITQQHSCDLKQRLEIRLKIYGSAWFTWDDKAGRWIFELA